MTVATTSRPGRRTGGSGWVVPLSVLIVGSFMSVLDTSIVNVAIPRMQVDLSAAPKDVEWVVTGYTLALGVVVPLSGWLGQRLGQTRLYVISMVGFAIGSALCGLAWNLDSMVFFRVLQAIPGGVLPVVTLTMIYQIVPPGSVGQAMGLYGLGTVVAPAVGPTLGGYLVEYVDWRLIFFINVPIGIVGTVLAVAVFPQIKPTSWPKLDLLGFVTVAYGLSAFLLAFSKAEDWGWTSYPILGLCVSAAISLALFVVIELEVDAPLIDMRIFRSYPYTLSLVLLTVAITGLFSGLYFLPQYLQQVQGMQELDSGLVMVPAALVLVVLMPVAGRLYDRFGPRYPVMVGLSILAYGSYLLAQITPSTPRQDIEIWLAIRNLGVGLSMMPIITAGVSALPRTLTASGSGMNNVMQRVASSVAVAVFGSLNAQAAAQMMINRGLLIGSGAQAPPEVARAQEQGPDGLLGLYTEMSHLVTTTTYANGFFITAVMGVCGVLLASTMRSGRAKLGGEPVVVEM